MIAKTISHYYSTVLSRFFKILVPCVSVVLLFSFVTAQAQEEDEKSFEEILQSLSEIAAKSYVKPVVDGLDPI